MSADSRPTILLTGASGALGQRLAGVLARLGSVVGVYRNRPVENGLRCDLSDGKAVARLLREVKPNVVVHAAALADVDHCEREPDRAYEDNVIATRHLVESFGPSRGRLTYISTDQVYDGPGPHKEDAVRPRNVYALTKLHAEDLVSTVPNGLILRTNFFGIASGPKRDFVASALDICQTGGTGLLFADVHVSPLHVSDLCEFMLELLCKKACGIVNLGTRDGVSKAGLVRRVGAKLGVDTRPLRDGSVADLELPAYRPRDMRMNVALAESVLDRRLQTVDEAVDRYCAEIGKTETL